ncbi:hypothetical protein EPUS_07968 [Endocarpon pusillum Z07020]|uniref:Uncharacterized protein n=1 Tax=Endocarpon pusillum (strain Z07020 / HMAS-L-300199) TaxID=1263415 RepID=U1G021_ENDPU|nr:uncharacterized protein EPUS_07968 [Endocarpon pusillum Z07020]ERF70547.1 hypothetical protein EPUS_07968 [Endocarpon pusillum Z07020]
MSSFFYGGHQQQQQHHPHNVAASHSHHGRTRRAPRLSASQNPNRQYRARPMKDVNIEAPNVTAFRVRFEAGRSFDLDDDLEFCPNLLTDDERLSINSGSSDRSSLSSGSPDASPIQHQIQPQQQVTPAISLSSAGSSFVSPNLSMNHQIKIHQPSAVRTRNAIPIVNPSTGMRVASPPSSISPGMMQQTTAALLNYVSLWTDSTNPSFYAWGGEISYALPLDQLLPVPKNSVWKFTPADGGSGSWSEQAMPSNSIFSSLTRPAGAIGGYGNGTEYLMGGYSSRRTTPQTADVDGFVPIPGIVSYDIEAGTLKSLSATDYSIYGTAMYGQMQYVPFGAEGLLVVMGGSTSDAVEWTDRGSKYVSFETITIFDSTTNSWHNQIASGTIPDSRPRFCSVAASGDNGTYEIFIYVGYVASASGEPQASNTAAQRL